METVAMRIPKLLQKDVKEMAHLEGVDQSTALRKLLELGVTEWRMELALRKLADGRITLWKAAEMARVSLWDMANVARRRGTILPIRKEDVLADISSH